MKKFQTIDFKIDYNGRRYQITAIPQSGSENQGLPLKFKITFESHPMGTLIRTSEKWKSDNIIDQRLVDIIGSNIHARFE